jgi:hypothetical protein
MTTDSTRIATKVSTKATAKIELDARPTLIVPRAEASFAGWGPRLRY